jgi:hypothetical protein
MRASESVPMAATWLRQSKNESGGSGEIRTAARQPPPAAGRWFQQAESGHFAERISSHNSNFNSN